MKIIQRFFFLFLIISGTYSFSKATLLNFEIQRSWNAKDHDLVYSLGACRMSQNGSYYLEGGFVLMPSFSSQTVHPVQNFTEEIKYTKSAYGFYAGYHLNLFPIFRPGIVVGSSLKNENIYRKSVSTDLTLADEKEAVISPYFGLSIHSGIFSFVYSNYGIGGGINLTL